MRFPLLERASKEILEGASIVIQYILHGLPDVTEMRNNRGQHYNSTNFYQLRIKPIEKDAISLEELQDDLLKFLNNKDSKKFGITNVQLNPHSVNSSKYSSVSFSFNGIDYDVVIASGANKGEAFEKKLLLKMDEFIAAAEKNNHMTIGDADHAKAAFDALEKIDPAFKIENVASVTPRQGSTQRSSDMTPEEAGKIIADIVVHLKKGGSKYISVKNKDGSTVGQFGLSKFINDDLSINQQSKEWKGWLEPFGLDAEKITEGLKAARDGLDLEWDDIEYHSKSINKKHPVFKIMQQFWGANYYYLREGNGGFTALKIDSDYIDNVVLKNLKVTEIRYPSKHRKQINIYLESDKYRFKLEARNPRGRGSVKPTQIQMKIMGGSLT